MGGKEKGKPLTKKTVAKFFVDCKQPVEDNIMDISQLEKYFQDRIKVNGKTGNLGEVVKVGREKQKVLVSVASDIQFSKLLEVPHEEVLEEAEPPGLLARHRAEEGHLRAQVLQHQQQRRRRRVKLPRSTSTSRRFRRRPLS